MSTPSPGPWTVDFDIAQFYRIEAQGTDNLDTVAEVPLTGDEEYDRDVTVANARLIAEAGTVATETGLTPRQLAEQRAELLEALQAMVDHAGEEEEIGGGLVGVSSPTDASKEAYTKARAAIRNATQG